MTTLCHDCGALTIAAARGERCGECGSRRQVCYAALDTLSIAHVDRDAFYATVEKRDRRDFADRPVIIGGGSRGALLTCCYVARLCIVEPLSGRRNISRPSAAPRNSTAPAPLGSSPQSPFGSQPSSVSPYRSG